MFFYFSTSHLFFLLYLKKLCLENLLSISIPNLCIFLFQRQLDSESSKVSSKKAMEKIEMLNNRRQEVNISLLWSSVFQVLWCSLPDQVAFMCLQL